MTHLAMTSANLVDRSSPGHVYAFADGQAQAESFAKACHAELGSCDVHRFPDGETLLTARPAKSLKGRTVALYRSLHDPNIKLTEVILAANSIRGLGATKLILVAPYLPYMRQDRAFVPGQAVSQIAVGSLLAMYFDAFVTVQPHLHRTLSLSSVFEGKPALALSAGSAFATHMRGMAHDFGAIVGPDVESEPLVREVAGMLRTNGFVAKKHRRGDRDVVIELPEGIVVKGRPVAIVDDIVSSGGTVATVAKALKQAGAGEITVYVVHALFDQQATLLMQKAGVSNVVSTDAVPHPTNAIRVVEIICKGLGVVP